MISCRISPLISFSLIFLLTHCAHSRGKEDGLRKRAGLKTAPTTRNQSKDDNHKQEGLKPSPTTRGQLKDDSQKRAGFKPAPTTTKDSRLSTTSKPVEKKSSEDHSFPKDRRGGFQTRPQEDSEKRKVELLRLIQEELNHPDLAKLRVSLTVATINPNDPDKPLSQLYDYQSDRLLVPASNAKLFTTAAAATLLRGHHWKTQIKKRGSRLYLVGGGDPLLNEKDIIRMAKHLAKRIKSVRGITVDDSYFSRRQLAPGFQKFLPGSPYRPTCGALNLGANAITVKVSAPKGRRFPRIDVYPPSDYVKVRKLVRFYPKLKKKLAKKKDIKLAMNPRGSILWLTISGKMGHQASDYIRKKAVYDPALNAGWALRRALKNEGVKVEGIVTRGRTPKNAKVVVEKKRSLQSALYATNRHSHNLAAETLIRSIGRKTSEKATTKEWEIGLKKAAELFSVWKLDAIQLKNGSGLHRSTKTNTRTIVKLLSHIWNDSYLKKRLLSTLAIAGKAGTLGGRMRKTAAQGSIHAKTGTLGSVLALSGYVIDHDNEKNDPLIFSMLINGSARRKVRAHLDRIAVLLARYVKKRPLIDRELKKDKKKDSPATKPTANTQPVAQIPPLIIPKIPKLPRIKSTQKI